jgi:electron-transferring-flavoprotein dehydrogenase
MLAAEAAAEALAGAKQAELTAYTEKFQASWLYRELKNERNLRPAFAKLGLYGFLAYSGIDTFMLRGRAPWTMTHRHKDSETLKRADQCKKIEYPKPDGKLTFDRLSSVFISNTNHEEDQPVHLKLRDPSKWLPVNWEEYRSPESRYCPAGVYEAVGVEEGHPRLQRTACIAKHATSRIRRRISTGQRPKAAAARITRGECDYVSALELILE